jgi:hypothetical protein
MRLQKAFFLQRTYCLGTDFEADFFAFDNKGLLLQVRLPNLFGVSLRKADAVAELLAFASNCTFLSHVISPKIYKRYQAYILLFF